MTQRILGYAGCFSDVGVGKQPVDRKNSKTTWIGSTRIHPNRGLLKTRAIAPGISK